MIETPKNERVQVNYLETNTCGYAYFHSLLQFFVYCCLFILTTYSSNFASESAPYVSEQRGYISGFLIYDYYFYSFKLNSSKKHNLCKASTGRFKDIQKDIKSYKLIKSKMELQK